MADESPAKGTPRGAGFISVLIALAAMAWLSTLRRGKASSPAIPVQSSAPPPTQSFPRLFPEAEVHSADQMAVTTATPRSTRAARPTFRLQYASFEARIAAATLDLLVLFIIGAVFITAGSLVVLISSDFERVDASTMSINIFWILTGSIVPAILLYFFVAYAWKGQTVGFAVMQLMVVRSDGRPLGVIGSVARVIGLLVYAVLIAVGVIAAIVFQDSTPIVAGCIGGALVLCVLALGWAAFDSKRRTLHDRLAGTIVVRIQ